MLVRIRIREIPSKQKEVYIFGIAFISQVQSAYFDELKRNNQQNNAIQYSFKTGGQIDAGIVIVKLKEWDYIKRIPKIRENIINELSQQMIGYIGLDIHQEIRGIAFAVYKMILLAENLAEDKDVSKLTMILNKLKGEKNTFDEIYLKGLIEGSNFKDVLTTHEIKEVSRIFSEKLQKNSQEFEEELKILFGMCRNAMFIIDKVMFLDILFESYIKST